jgi:hypothetical protein
VDKSGECDDISGDDNIGLCDIPDVQLIDGLCGANMEWDDSEYICGDPLLGKGEPADECWFCRLWADTYSS